MRISLHLSKICVWYEYNASYYKVIIQSNYTEIIFTLKAAKRNQIQPHPARIKSLHLVCWPRKPQMGAASFFIDNNDNDSYNINCICTDPIAIDTQLSWTFLTFILKIFYTLQQMKRYFCSVNLINNPPNDFIHYFFNCRVTNWNIITSSKVTLICRSLFSI